MNDNNPSAADPFGEIADECVEALRQGQRPSAEEFARRYPEHTDDIRDILPAPVLMEQAKSAEDTPGQRRQADAAPLRQIGDCQTLREVGRGGRGRESSDRQRNEQLRAPVRDTELSLRRGVRRAGHIDRGSRRRLRCCEACGIPE
jgi:hypothetical protein